jgi:hypothetical protein
MNEEHLIERLLQNNEKQVKLAQIKYYIVCSLLALSLIGNFVLMSLSKTTYIDTDQDNNGDYNINEVTNK